jgi:hypothetical protein
MKHFIGHFAVAFFVATVLLSAMTAVAQSPEPLNPEVPPEKPGGREKVIGAIKEPKVAFVSPKEGDVVKAKFKAKFSVEGMKVKAAGAMDVGSGHHHVIVDGGPIPKGQVVPKDDKNLHFGKGETEAWIDLSKVKQGDHTLTLQFADGAHKSYGPELSQTINITVIKVK